MKKTTTLLAILSLTFLISTAYAGDEFSETWETNWGTVTLVQTGSSVAGSYTGPYDGNIEGTVKEGRLLYRWIQPDGQWGRGFFVLDPGGASISGRWGAGVSDSNGGVWKGTRKR